MFQALKMEREFDFVRKGRFLTWLGERQTHENPSLTEIKWAKRRKQVIYDRELIRINCLFPAKPRIMAPADLQRLRLPFSVFVFEASRVFAHPCPGRRPDGNRIPPVLRRGGDVLFALCRRKLFVYFKPFPAPRPAPLADSRKTDPFINAAASFLKTSP